MMDLFLDASELLSFSFVCEPSNMGVLKKRFTTIKTEEGLFEVEWLMQTAVYGGARLNASFCVLPDGTKHGEYSAVYERNLIKALGCTFVDGVLEGKYRIWGIEGYPVLELDVFNGKAHGYCTLWSYDGKFDTRYTLKNSEIVEIEGKDWISTLCRASKPKNKVYITGKNFTSSRCILIKNIHECMEKKLEMTKVRCPNVKIPYVRGVRKGKIRSVSYSVVSSTLIRAAEVENEIKNPNYRRT